MSHHSSHVCYLRLLSGGIRMNSRASKIQLCYKMCSLKKVMHVF